MSNEIFETFSAFTQQTLENWKKLGETNLKLTEKLLREQVELTNSLVETATAGAQEAAATKDVKDFAGLQAELAQEYGKKMMETSRSYADILAEAGKTYNQFFEAGVKSASDNFTATPKAKAKKAA